MEVNLAPDLHARIDRLATAMNRPPAKLIEDAVAGHVVDLEETQDAAANAPGPTGGGDHDGQRSITEIIRDRAVIDEALDKAFYRAVKLHREANVPMSFTDENHKPYEMDSKDIEIPEKYADLEPFRY